MIPRRVPLKRSRKPIPKQRKTARAALARQCQALWSQQVKRKNGGRCIVEGQDDLACSGVLDPGHCFPKRVGPWVRYDVDFGEPICRTHHLKYGNGVAWRLLLRKRWGKDVYEARDLLAHTAGRKLDLAAVLEGLRAA